MKNIGNTLPKVDARANMLGGAVYVEDYPRLPGTLIVRRCAARMPTHISAPLIRASPARCRG